MLLITILMICGGLYWKSQILTIFKIIFKTDFRTSFKQYLTFKTSKHLTEVHHKHYLVHYPYGIHWYTIMIPRNRVPCNFSRVFGVNEESRSDSEGIEVEITDHIKSLMGPCYNFHGIPTSPKMLGYQKIIFEGFDSGELLSDSEKTIFELDNQIII